MKRKKILFLAEELETNGAVMSLLALLKALPSKKYEVSLFLFKHGVKMMDEIPPYIHVFPEYLPYSIHRMPRKQACTRALKNLRIDLLLYRVVVAGQRALGKDFILWKMLPNIPGHYDIACCYTDGFVAPMMMRKVDADYKCSWIHLPYTVCGFQPSVYQALKQMDMCVPVSEDTGRELDKVLGGHVPQHIVHNITDVQSCIDRAKEPCEKGRIPGVHRIVSVGRVTPQKFFDIIPPVAQLLKARNIPFEWYVVGNGDKYEELKQQTSDMQLDDRVHFIGARPNPMPWIKSADVFVNPSRFEAWGMTVSEALCLGKAVIVSDIPVFKEQITDGVNGIICHITPANLANDIERILTDSNLRHKLECNALSYPFTKESVVKEFDELIEKLCLPKE